MQTKDLIFQLSWLETNIYLNRFVESYLYFTLKIFIKNKVGMLVISTGIKLLVDQCGNRLQNVDVKLKSLTEGAPTGKYRHTRQ